MMKWLGLTGGIATGKSTVAEIIKQSGYPVINADEVAHQALSPEGPIFAEIVKAFGREIVDGQGQIDRRRLGAKVFKNEPQRLKLESLVHPFVKQKVKSLRAELEKQGHAMAFYDVPLLYEVKMEGEFAKVVLVWCDEALQLDRLMKRSGLSPIEARERIQAQLPLAEKIKKADILIENNSDVSALKAAVSKALGQLQS